MKYNDGYVRGLRYALERLAESVDFPELKRRLDRELDRFVGRLRSRESSTAADGAVTGTEESSQVPSKIEPAAEGHCWRIRARVSDGVAIFLNEYGFPSSRDVLGTYDPLSNAGLLRRFTTLDFGRDEAVEEFYEEFGPLTFPAAWNDPSALPFDGFGLRGEPVQWLQKEAGELRLLLDLHAAQREDRPRLRLRRLRQILASIPRDEGLPGSGPFDPYEDRLVLPAVIRLPKDRSVARAEDLTRAQCEGLARDILKKRIDQRLQGLRRVVGTVPVESGGRGRARSADGAFVPRWRFSCLRDALYLQVYDIVTHDRGARVCLACGRAFPLGQGLRGRPRDYCTDRCRYRANKRHKRDLT